MNPELLAALLGRLQESRAKRRLESLLKRIKQEQDVPRQTFRASGTIEQLREAVGRAAAEGLISAQDLASLVDEAEENGAQHIFLFDLNEAGKARARSQEFRATLPALPAQPTPAMYAELPGSKRTYLSARTGRVVVKQIYKAEYWEKDEEASRTLSNENRRVNVTIRRERRAINLLSLDPVLGRAEVRIDRVRGQLDDSLALDLFAQFKDDLSEVFDFDSLSTPVEIWRAFPAIVADREGTYMSTDGAKDASVSITISNRRENELGTDVRNHPTYAYATDDYVRDTLNVYWLRGGEKVHTILSRVPGTGLSKVYVAAKLEPSLLDYVIERIRQSTLDAP